MFAAVRSPSLAGDREGMARVSEDDSGVDDAANTGDEAARAGSADAGAARGNDAIPASELTDEDLWPEGADDDPGHRRGVSPLVIVLGAAAVLAVIIVLLATGGSGSDDDGNAATSSTGSTSGTKATTTTKASGPSWPTVAQGRPAVFGELRDPITSVDPEAKPGVYAWVDYDGWHVWIVGPEGKAAAKGTLTSNVDFTEAQPAVKGEGTVTVDGSEVKFDFSEVEAGAAGTSFNLGFYATEVTISLGGTDLPLLLGSEAKASPIPAVIAKQVQPS